MFQSDVGRKARELYEARIRHNVEAGNRGRYVVIDVNSGDYEVGDDYTVLTDHVRARHPDPELFTLRIGFPAVGRIGGRARPARS
jgi:hypothetical protein